MLLRQDSQTEREDGGEKADANRNRPDTDGPLLSLSWTQ